MPFSKLVGRPREMVCFLSQGQNNTNMDIERLKVMSSMIENNKNESMKMVDPGRSM